METRDPVLEAIRRRLYGSANRVAWRPEDVTRILARFGLSKGDARDLDIAAYRSGTVEPLRRDAAPAAKDGSRSFTFTISTADVDRMGDTVAIAGWKLSAYRKNPIVLWAHDSGLIPIGKATRIWIEGPRLKATAELAPADANPEAEQVRKLIEGGYLAATSVGFIPLKYAFSDDPQRRYGIDFLEQELLEFSVVPIPANPHALIDSGQTGKAKTAAQKRRHREVEILKLRTGRYG